MGSRRSLVAAAAVGMSSRSNQVACLMLTSCKNSIPRHDRHFGRNEIRKVAAIAILTIIALIRIMKMIL